MIYVLCPADVKTGGTELLHQLVKTLTDVKVPAGIVYTEISEEHPGMNQIVIHRKPPDIHGKILISRRSLTVNLRHN